MGTIFRTNIVFDTGKDAANVAKHGLSLALAEGLDWESAVTWSDSRRAYGEPRQCGIGYIGDRLYVLAFVDRDGSRRIISLRKANKREERRYAEA